MADEPPAPGRDEIIVTAPAGRQPCGTLSHARLGCLAEVVVTFGELTDEGGRDGLWLDTWGRSYGLCGECWDITRQIARGRRPGLVITDMTGTATVTGDQDDPSG